MQNWYIYFDDIGKIYSVTNEKKLSGNYFETSEENVKDFINGRKQFSSFTVKLNENKTYNVLENENLSKLKYCNLEKLTIDRIKKINFRMHNLLIFVCYKDNFNFLKSTFIVDSEESALNCIDSSCTVFFQRVLKNENY